MTPTIVECQMLIRKPAEEVFRAFTDPEITTRFWFTRSSGVLEKGKTVTWEWEMYGVSAPVFTEEIIPGKLIRIQWGDPATTVDFTFHPREDGNTYVIIKNYGFNLSGEDLIQAVKDNTGGFTTVLDGLKAWLEFGIELRLIADKFPAGK